MMLVKCVVQVSELAVLVVMKDVLQKLQCVQSMDTVNAVIMFLEDLLVDLALIGENKQSKNSNPLF